MKPVYKNCESVLISFSHCADLSKPSLSPSPSPLPSSLLPSLLPLSSFLSFF